MSHPRKIPGQRPNLKANSWSYFIFIFLGSCIYKRLQLFKIIFSFHSLELQWFSFTPHAVYRGGFQNNFRDGYGKDYNNKQGQKRFHDNNNTESEYGQPPHKRTKFDYDINSYGDRIYDAPGTCFRCGNTSHMEIDCYSRFNKDATF